MDGVAAINKSGKSMDDLVLTLKTAGLTTEEIVTDADALAASLRRVNDVGDKIDTHLTRNMQNVARGPTSPGRSWRTWSATRHRNCRSSPARWGRSTSLSVSSQSTPPRVTSRSRASPRQRADDGRRCGRVVHQLAT